MRVSREAIVLAVVFAIFGALYPLLVLRRRTRDPVRDCSTYRTNATGTKALFGVLQELGVSVRRLRRPALHVPADASVLCLLCPTSPVEPDEAEAVREWVRDGGTLVASCAEGPRLMQGVGPVAVDPCAALRRDLRLPAARPRGSLRALPVDGAGPELQDVHRVEVPSGMRFTEEGHVLVGDASGSVVLERKVGRGTVILLAEPRLFSNAELQKGDNALLAANLFFRHMRGGTVYFDEYHHGFTEAVSLARLLDESGLGRASWPAAAALVLALLAAGRRLGRARRPPRAERRSGSEFVRAMSALYGEAGAGGAVLRVLCDAWRRRLAQSLGTGGGLPDERLVEAVARRGGDAKGTLSMLQSVAQATQQAGLSEEELVALAQRLSRLDEGQRHSA